MVLLTDHVSPGSIDKSMCVTAWPLRKRQRDSHVHTKYKVHRLHSMSTRSTPNANLEIYHFFAFFEPNNSVHKVDEHQAFIDCNGIDSFPCIPSSRFNWSLYKCMA